MAISRNHHVVTSAASRENTAQRTGIQGAGRGRSGTLAALQVTDDAEAAVVAASERLLAPLIDQLRATDLSGAPIGTLEYARRPRR